VSGIELVADLSRALCLASCLHYGASIAGSSARLTVGGVTATAVVWATVILLWEMRARRMGFRVTDDHLVATRAFGTEKVRWTDIDGFFLRKIGLWSDRTIRIQRKKLLGVGAVRGVGRPLPTVLLPARNNPIGRRLGPCDLVCGVGDVPEDQVLEFLQSLLAEKRQQRTTASLSQ